MSYRLLILTCSRQKRNDSGLLPALERYDGPPFRVVRKYRRDQPSSARLLNIQILSAKFGLLDMEQPIPDYEQKMLDEKAEDLQSELYTHLEMLVKDNHYETAFIYASQVYIKALGNYRAVLPTDTRVVTLGSTPGYKLAELSRWLYQGHQPYTNSSIKNKKKPVTINGIEINYTAEEIFNIARQKLTHKPLCAPNYSAWYVAIDEQKIAPKWLVAQLTELPLSSFHTDTARRVLEQLGIKVYKG